jgi:Cu+-exporting ATPase
MSLTATLPATEVAASHGVRLQIEGMTCASCVARVEKALKKVPGVEAAEVNLATEVAEVTLTGHATSTDALIAAVEKAGYSACPISTAAGTTSASAAGPEWWPVAVAALLSAPLLLQMLGMLLGRDWIL